MIASLRFRLAAGALLAIALVLLATGFILSSVFTDYVVKRYRSEMAAVMDQLAAETEFRDGALVVRRKPSDPRFQLPASGRYWQILPAGGSPVRSPSLWDTVLDPHADPAAYGFTRAVGPDGLPVLVAERALVLRGNADGSMAIAFRVLSAFPADELEASLDDYHSTLRIMLLLTAAVLTGAAYLQGAIGLRPLIRLREQVGLVRAGTASLVADDGPSELKPLVTELNLLLRERQTALERARARASDLAHGLKTPLTVLQQLADRLPEADRALARQQVELVRQRADRQLQAARLGVEQMASTQLSGLCGKLVMVLAPMTRERAIRWENRIPADLAVGADAADLAECLGNILDNASKWAASAIVIEAAQTPDGRISMLIRDDGPGIAEADRERLLERGERGEPAGGTVSGSGLGLAISRDIVTAYGGSLSLEPSEGGGLAVRLDLPAA